VRASVDKVAASLLRNPQAVDQVVAAEADQIASSVGVKAVSPSNIEKAKRSVVNIEVEIKEIDLAAQTIKERMNEAATAQGFNSGGESSSGPSSGGILHSCTCKCGSRVVWGPVIVPSCTPLLALCPPIPCR
jgi:hypothetical protein